MVSITGSLRTQSREEVSQLDPRRDHVSAALGSERKNHPNHPFQFAETFITTLCLMHAQLSNSKGGFSEAQRGFPEVPQLEGADLARSSGLHLVPLPHGPASPGPTHRSGPWTKAAPGSCQIVQGRRSGVFQTDVSQGPAASSWLTELCPQPSAWPCGSHRQAGPCDPGQAQLTCGDTLTSTHLSGIHLQILNCSQMVHPRGETEASVGQQLAQCHTAQWWQLGERGS